MKYRKKPVVIEAMKFTKATFSECKKFCPLMYFNTQVPNGAMIPTMEGVMICNNGDWIIKGVKGEFYPCKPEIFEMTYEEENS